MRAEIAVNKEIITVDFGHPFKVALTGGIGPQGNKGDTGNGIESISLNSDYTLTINFTDGTSYTTESIRGAKGDKGDKGDTGNGILSTVLNPDYTLTINFTDGTSFTTAPIRGAKGDDGVGIASTVLNPDYTLTITLTDGTSYTTPSIRGEKGDTGRAPQITAEKSGSTTTIYADGVAIGAVEDGKKGDKGDVGTPSFVDGIVIYS